MLKWISSIFACLCLTGVLVAAPAPVPKIRVPPDVRALYEAADKQVLVAESIEKRLSRKSNSLTETETARLEKEQRNAWLCAAEKYAHVIRRVNGTRDPHKEAKEFAVCAAIEAIHAYYMGRDSEAGLRLHNRLVYRPSSSLRRLEMMSRLCRCLAALDQFHELKRFIPLMREEIDKLNKSQRGPWTKWVDFVEEMAKERLTP